MFPKVTLVLGGVRSGKSDFAERFAEFSGLNLTYVATACEQEAGMDDRIAAHRARRGEAWTTIEEPRDISGILCQQPGNSAILVDCATLWLSGQLEAGGDVGAATDDLLRAIAESAASVVVVSNEVGLGGVGSSKLVREFADAQGLLNQRLAQVSDLTVLVAAGLPMVLKGKLPPGFQ